MTAKPYVTTYVYLRDIFDFFAVMLLITLLSNDRSIRTADFELLSTKMVNQFSLVQV